MKARAFGRRRNRGSRAMTRDQWIVQSALWCNNTTIVLGGDQQFMLLGSKPSNFPNPELGGNPVIQSVFVKRLVGNVTVTSGTVGGPYSILFGVAKHQWDDATSDYASLIIGNPGDVMRDDVWFDVRAKSGQLNSSSAQPPTASGIGISFDVNIPINMELNPGWSIWTHVGNCANSAGVATCWYNLRLLVSTTIA